MDKQKLAKNAGLAAVIMLAPGGFVLGAALLARRWQAGRTPPAGATPEPPPPEGATDA